MCIYPLLDFSNKDFSFFIFFIGLVPNGLIVHPEGEHIVYPLGCTVIIQELASKKQSFLVGHTDNISCLACSPSGQYLASGQVSDLVI